MLTQAGNSCLETPMQTRQVILTESRVEASRLAPLGDLEPQLLLVFASPDRIGEDGRLETVRAALPAATLIGCSTAGEITSSGGHEHSCTLTGVRFDGPVQLRSASVSVPTMPDSLDAGRPGPACRAGVRQGH